MNIVDDELDEEGLMDEEEGEEEDYDEIQEVGRAKECEMIGGSVLVNNQFYQM